jgi:hypothetical protein
MFTSVAFSLAAVLLVFGIAADSLRGCTFAADGRRSRSAFTRHLIREERMDEGKHSIELIRGGEGIDLQIVLAREDDLKIAHTLFSVMADKYPDKLIMLCHRARVLARNDFPETMSSC